MDVNSGRLPKLTDPAGANIMEEIVMNNSLRKKMMTGMAATAALAAVLLAAGCPTTVQSTPEAAKAVESGGPLPSSVTGFLGPDASQAGSRARGRRRARVDKSQRSMEQLHQDTADAG